MDELTKIILTVVWGIVIIWFAVVAVRKER